MADTPDPDLDWTTCPACGTAGAVALRLHGGTGACRSCHRPVEGVWFRAARQSRLPPLPEDPPGEGDTPCFYNPRRKATTSCSQCGVFISDAWAAKWGAQTLCLRCLEKMRASRRTPQFETQRWLWDNICLALVAVPFTFVFWWLAPLTAPAALILGLWAWRKPGSLVPRGKWRLALAIVLAAAQVVGGIALVYAMVQAIASA